LNKHCAKVIKEFLILSGHTNQLDSRSLRVPAFFLMRNALHFISSVNARTCTVSGKVRNSLHYIEEFSVATRNSP
jgi:hypothetical protein